MSGEKQLVFLLYQKPNRDLLSDRAVECGVSHAK